jgi:Spy/CpxP family protein refolding chaperone
MKRFISILVVVLLAVPTMALAGPGFKRGFKHGFGHGFNRLNPVMVKKVLTDAGASDQQIRRVQGLIDETKTKTLDVKHELEKARLDVEQLMRAENPDRAAIFKQIDKIGETPQADAPALPAEPARPAVIPSPNPARPSIIPGGGTPILLPEEGRIERISARSGIRNGTD